MDIVIRRLKQRVPVTGLDLETVAPVCLDSLDQQQKLLETLEEVSEHNAHYAKSVLKKLVLVFEQANIEVADEIYETLAVLLQAPPLGPADNDLISYSLETTEPHSPDLDKTIVVSETPNLISGLGTTGMRTWEASLYLSEYLLSDLNQRTGSALSEDFYGKTVIEIGCGTGILGMALAKHYNKCGKVILTDGDSRMVENLAANLSLNELQAGGDSKLKLAKFWWGEDDLPDPETNTIIGADVTYDASIIPDLIHVINEAMTQNNRSNTLVDTAYIAATVRNEDTLAVWEEFLEMGRQDGVWIWSVDSGWQGSGLVWYPPGTPEIRVYKLERHR